MHRETDVRLIPGGCMCEQKWQNPPLRCLIDQAPSVKSGESENTQRASGRVANPWFHWAETGGIQRVKKIEKK